MDCKRKRSSNYSAQEIAMLLDLVEKHRSIVEDKRSGAVYLVQKKETWEKIRNSFNSAASSGTRSVEQLKVLYDNKKQKARKVLAEYNKQEYIKNISEKDICDAKKHDKEDKIQLKKTGGGTWCPTVSEHDKKVLELIKNHFGDVICEMDSSNQIVIEAELEEELGGASDKNNLDAETPDTSFIMNRPSSSYRNVSVKKHDESQHYTPVSRKSKVINQINRSRSLLKKEKTSFRNKMNYKLLYFKRKCQNAVLEKRKLYQQIRLRQKEYNLIVKEHNLKMKQMEEEHNIKMDKLKSTT